MDTQKLSRDPHSFANPEEVCTLRLQLNIRVDMEMKRIRGVATYLLTRKSGNVVIFDTDGLLVEKVTGPYGAELHYELKENVEHMGQALHVTLPEGVAKVNIHYATGPNARALQWLEPSQTTDKRMPFMFTQGQATLTRSWIPIQDSPGIRFTYTARVLVPQDLMAVMSAENPRIRNSDGVYRFAMNRAVPAYLIALAVGDIVFKPIGDRTGVYAEPGVIDKAVKEFYGTEKMVKVAEELYGAYRWKNYDILVLPSSFPFGGMENPMLTFMTPSVIAGDRSLVSIVAHELAHSWSGNLVTNATWNDFWLNEGTTVYFEQRIMEALHGVSYSNMMAVLHEQDLLADLKRIAGSEHPEDSCLKLNLVGRDADDGMTQVAYYKGYALLRLIENKVGRPKFDAFLRTYFDKFAFKSMTTERFVEYLKDKLLRPNGVELNLDAWIYEPGLPENNIVPSSLRFEEVEDEINRWQNGTPADLLSSDDWSAFERVHFLRHLPKTLTENQMIELDATFGFTKSGNSEILVAWLESCIRNNYSGAYKRLEEFLVNTGRRKFLTPLYREMLSTNAGKEMAERIYERARPNYHSVATRTIDDMLAKALVEPAKP